jgi:hypothetical protein
LHRFFDGQQIQADRIVIDFFLSLQVIEQALRVVLSMG